MKILCLFTTIWISLFSFSFAETKQTEFKNPDDIIVITLKDNKKVYIELRPDIAPKHVERIKTLTKQGFYDDIVFHRVIDGFMAQTGDPTGTGTGGSDLPDLRTEFSRMPHLRGAVSMARANSPHSANSQFFICFKDSTFLDNQYTYFGKVLKGMENVDNIKKGNEKSGGMVTNPDKIYTMRILADDK